MLAQVDGQLVPMPINLDTVNRLYGLNLTSFEMEAFLASVAEQASAIRTSEDVVVSKVGRELYEKFFRGYTRKQWGLDPSELDAPVTARVPTRTNRDDRYFTDTYQAMPLHGYTRMFERMLDAPEHQDHAQHRLPRDRRARALPGDDLHRPDRRRSSTTASASCPTARLEFRHETLDQEQVLPGVAGMGFGVASLIRSDEGASAVVNLIVLPMAFLSGSLARRTTTPRCSRRSPRCCRSRTCCG